MEKIDNDTVDPEYNEELGEGLEFKLPVATRFWFTFFSALLCILILGIYGYLLLCRPHYIDPDKYGLPEILLGAVTIILFMNVPWNKLGFRVKKIGMIELEQVVKRQAVVRSNEVADLQKEIDELRKSILPKEKLEAHNDELDNLILEFLSKYNRWAFSALRIKKWGGEQKGFEKFREKQVTTSKIRESLRRLLAEKKVITTVSKKGNTIYKAK